MKVIVRPFHPAEAGLYRATRLKALQTDPHVFGQRHEDAERALEDRWTEDLVNPDLAVFGVFDEEKCIGMTGAAIDRDDPSGGTVKLWGSWLEPAYRGKGISEEMYRVRLDWAKSRPGVVRVTVSHRESNRASMMANRKHGFIFTRREDRLWHDGRSEPEIFYELRV